MIFSFFLSSRAALVRVGLGVGTAKKEAAQGIILPGQQGGCALCFPCGRADYPKFPHCVKTRVKTRQKDTLTWSR